MKNTLSCLALLLFCFCVTAQPLGDITERRIIKERKVLKYPKQREADIFWEKRIWRVLDVREKMNHPFTYPNKPFFSIMTQAAERGDITLYSPEDDQFNYPLDTIALNNILFQVDTVEITDPVTQVTRYQEIHNSLNWEDIKRYRIKEVWFFDEQTATLRVRILGIAPLIEVYDDNDNFRYEIPLFWAYYPELREILAREQVFNEGNDSSTISWEDHMEMRFFSSTIYKASNVHDRRLEETLSGVDLLMEADKIKKEIFNFEHDLWSY